jgi:hypothetical protein
MSANLVLPAGTKKNEKQINEVERGYAGCYGHKVAISQIGKFLETNFKINEENENNNQPKFAQCIWGHSGIGKTSAIKYFKNKKVTWNGKEYSGYKVVDVPMAQIEEMGDIHGVPMDCLLMKNEKEERWVPIKDQVILSYKELGYIIDTNVMPKTIMAPPEWVPITPEPTIVLFDDWNRASIRIVKGAMQIFQNYCTTSWKLPPGCNIVLTGNPDEQNYLVTSIDSAILTRIKHVTLMEDAKEWAVWATANDLDNRGISWILFQPEMMIGKERTNPRTLSEFFKVMKQIKDVENEKDKFLLHAHSLLDEESVTAFHVFMTRDMEDVIEPNDILEGKKEVYERLKNILDRKDPRVDILHVTCERLYATLLNSNVEQNESVIKNFQKFITNKYIPEDVRYSLCFRLVKREESNIRDQLWVLGNEILKKQILELSDNI